MKAQWEMKLCRKVHPIKILIRVGRWQHEVARRASPVQAAKLARAAEPLFAGTGLNEPRFCGQGILQKFEPIVQPVEAGTKTRTFKSRAQHSSLHGISQLPEVAIVSPWACTLRSRGKEGQ